MTSRLSKSDEAMYEVRDFQYYLADLGAVGFSSILAVILAGVTFEIVYPGLVFNHISPQRLVLGLAIFALLALLSPGRERSLWRRLSFAGLSLLTAVFIALFAWSYFAALADRLALTAVAVIVTLIIMLGALCATDNSEIE
jgi:apolipoprotein N-acyltransferase